MKRRELTKQELNQIRIYDERAKRLQAILKRLVKKQ